MKILSKILDSIYPPVCGICGKMSKEYICPKCNIILKNHANCKIEDYSQNTSYFDEHIYLFQYSGEVRNAVLNYKFKEKSYIYETFVNFLKNNENICNKIKTYDIIIPVPISKKRFRERGYNQSSIFAKKVAKNIQVPYKEYILKKIKDNEAQSTLSQENRKQNVQGVYKITNSQLLVNKNILLVDDIFTTGNTVNECSKILINAGAKKVGIFTIAKD